MTPNPRYSSTPTPTITFSPTPLPTPGGPAPVVRWGGYFNSRIDANTGGILVFLSTIIDRENDVQFVQLAYQGALSGVFLYDNGTHGDFRPGDSIFTRDFGTLAPGAPQGQFLLELVAEDSAQNRASPWPYFSVY